MVPVNPQQIWVRILRQLPDYLRTDTDYSQLVAFLQTYFQWLQTTGQPAELVADMATNTSIDDVTDTFIQYLIDQYLNRFPIIYDVTQTNATIKAQQHATLIRLVKHANEFYISKGNDDSFKTLFRVLFGEEIDLFFPKTVLFKPSDGHWEVPTTVKISVISGNISSINLTYGSVSAAESLDGTTNTLTGATGTVENIIASNNYYELFFTKGSLTTINKSFGLAHNQSISFAPGNKVILTSGTTVVVGTIFPVPSIYTINDTVLGHVAGSAVWVGNSTGTIDTNIILNVKSVTATGQIKAINVVNSYSDIQPTYTYLYDAQFKQIGTVAIGGLTYYPGINQTVEGVNLGFLSDQIKLRGPIPIKSLPNGISPTEYYQEFSYVVKSPISVNQWMPTVLGLLHPVGYQIFGDIVIRPEASSQGFDLLGLYRFNQDTVNDLDAYSAYKYHLVNIIPSGTSGYLQTYSQANPLGPTLESLNRFMMTFPSYTGGNTYYGATIPASNTAFGGTLAVPAWSASCVGSTQIKDYANLIVGNFKNQVQRTMVSNVMPQPFVLIE